MPADAEVAPLRPVVRRSVSDAVFDQLVAQIVGGAYPVGSSLPAERSLTEVFGVNRQAVREALKRLSQAGLVEIQQGGPTRVADFRSSGGLDLLPELLISSTGVVDVAVARSVMEMRACLGPDAARLSALRAVPAVVEDLQAVVETMDATDDLAALAALDWQFWGLVIDGSDNVAYRLALNSLRDAATSLGTALHQVRSAELRDHRGRRRIADAIAAGKPDAAERAARALLTRGTAEIATLLAGFDGAPRVDR